MGLSDSVDDLLADEPRPPVQRKMPAEWQPGLNQSSTGITLTTGPLEHEPDDAMWKELIADWGLDPKKHIILHDTMQLRGWDAAIGEGRVQRMKYYKVAVALLAPGVVRADVDELVKIAERRKPVREPVVSNCPAFVISANDWQIGKAREEGGGSKEAVERLNAAFMAVRARLREMTKLGRRPSRVVIADTGDLVEQVSGHYASQAFTVDLNYREQQRVVRRLLFALMDMLVTDGYPVTITATPCNHGENRNGDGKAFTTIDDNATLTLVESIEESCRANPDRYQGVDFAYAHDIALVLDVCGVNLGLTHGHQISGGRPKMPNRAKSTGAVGAAKVEAWWQGQIMGRRHIADADILLTSHLHHMQISEETGRTVIVAPAMDGGSRWYTDKTGKNSPPGMLTITVGDGHRQGWGDLAIF